MGFINNAGPTRGFVPPPSAAPPAGYNSLPRDQFARAEAIRRLKMQRMQPNLPVRGGTPMPLKPVGGKPMPVKAMPVPPAGMYRAFLGAQQAMPPKTGQPTIPQQPPVGPR